MNVLRKIKRTCKQKLVKSGVSDIMVVRWDNGRYRSTPFIVSFGTKAGQCQVQIQVNGVKINTAKFRTDAMGRLYPAYPKRKILQQMNLKYGPNVISFTQTRHHKTLYSQIYLYHQSDKLIVSDVDGTLTKSDIKGLWHNFFDRNHVHLGYNELLDKAHQNGYKIVWLTMRSFNLYQFSKRYITMHTNIPGPLFTQPTQLLTAVKAQITKDTFNSKISTLRRIRNIFPPQINPFAGGLGNRTNDALAYAAAQIPDDKIFLVDPYSTVQCWAEEDQSIFDYQHMHQNIQNYFPIVKEIFQAVMEQKIVPQTYQKKQETQYVQKKQKRKEIDLLEEPLLDFNKNPRRSQQLI